MSGEIEKRQVNFLFYIHINYDFFLFISSFPFPNYLFQHKSPHIFAVRSGARSAACSQQATTDAYSGLRVPADACKHGASGYTPSPKS